MILLTWPEALVWSVAIIFGLPLAITLLVVIVASLVAWSESINNKRIKPAVKHPVTKRDEEPLDDTPPSIGSLFRKL